MSQPSAGGRMGEPRGGKGQQECRYPPRRDGQGSGTLRASNGAGFLPFIAGSKR